MKTPQDLFYSAYEPDRPLLQQGYEHMRAERYGEAISILASLTELGSRLAPIYLGFLYENGKGVNRDVDKALSYYRISSDRGNASGQFYLGSLLRRIGSVELAAQEMRKAADQDFPPALYRMYLMFRDGNGVPKSRSESEKYFMKAVRLNHVYALRDKGYRQLKGYYGAPGFLVAPFTLARCFGLAMSAQRDPWNSTLY